MARNTSRFTEKQIADFQESFNLFDKDGDGAITTFELRDVIKSLGGEATDAQLAEIIRDVDTNKNGRIEFSEFVTMMGNAMEDQKTGEGDLLRAFQVFDKDKNGYISKDELRQVMESLEGGKVTEQDLQEMMTEADLDNDNRINYEEFVKMLTST